MTTERMCAEQKRLDERDAGTANWRAFGPYLAYRQWGTVREDYSADGDAWRSFTHDHARSRAYRWGEDGLAGFCDEGQRLCLSLALWNGRDPILKERLFGLANHEGNHGEDVKECYWFLDALPSGAWQRMLYKYPQRAFPYDELVARNAQAGKLEREFELLDTGVFDDDRYFDVVVEWAKADTDDILMRVEVVNRAPEPATIHVLPTALFRNTWSWCEGSARPSLEGSERGVLVDHPDLKPMRLEFDPPAPLLFCENDTNVERLHGRPRGEARFKDGINDAIVKGDAKAVNPTPRGTKVAAHHHTTIAPGASAVFRARLSTRSRPGGFADFDSVIAARGREADEFYAERQSQVKSEELRLIQRQAWAGLLWSKQTYIYEVRRWLDGDPALPPPPSTRRRNADWRHLDNHEVYCMPDSWEYPWYASWDLAFHCVALADIDADEAMRQLLLLVLDRSMHPSGQIPAYEWSFSDVNPPVHAWAAMKIYESERRQSGRSDRVFLRRIFHRLLLNFTWWVNRKDADGRNLFAGGFLGLDNIGVFDRSASLPEGATLQQADGTAWMGKFALDMMHIATELALEDPVYQDLATKFFLHFLDIASAMADFAGTGEGLWDERDEFYYDRVRLSSGETLPLQIQSIVGLLPLLAVRVLDPEVVARLPVFSERVDASFAKRPDLAALVSHWGIPGVGDQRLLSLLRGHRTKCLLKRMLDESQFLSDFGVRSMSKGLDTTPYVLWHDGVSLSVRYSPAEGTTGAFGGNSNWRGPVWMPVNYLLIEALGHFHTYYGDSFRVECPVGSGVQRTLAEVSRELAARLLRLFRVDASGVRPCLAEHPKLQRDSAFNRHLLFHEFFDGTTGRGCGASHQTGWTAMIARLIAQYPDLNQPERGGCP